MSERRVYLGRVEWAVAGGQRGPMAQLRPLYEGTPDALSWRPLENPKEAFPNRGFVTWFDPVADAVKGTLWQFRVEEQPSYKAENPNHDQFRVVQTPTPALEVLDLREDDDPEFARRLLTEDGLFLRFVPLRQVYLWVDEMTWVGPVHLVRAEQDGYWLLNPKEREVPLPCIRPLPSDQVAKLRIDEQRLILGPGAKGGSRIGLVDWAPDDVVLKRVLRWLRRTDRAYTDNLELTEKAIDRVVELLSDAGLSSADHVLELQRLRRACSMVGSLAEQQELAESLIKDLLQVPSIQATIQATIQAVTDQVTQETKDQIRAELEQSLNRITELQTQKARLEEEIANVRTILSAQVDELDAAVAQRLAELMARPGQAFTDLAILRAAFEPASIALKRGIVGTPISIEADDATQGSSLLSHLLPSISGMGGDLTCLSDHAQLRPILRRAFRARTVPIQVAKMLHAAFLAGAMPVLAGSGAFRALEAYAASITGGRWLWLPISPAMLEPSDLLGRVDPVARRFVPAAGGLLDLLLYARGRDELYLIILDGINRAAVESYLAPILACYTDTWCSGRGRSLSLFHPSAVATDDPYASMPQLVWPPNVLLAGMLIDGAASVPLPPSFWTAATLIHLDTYVGAAGIGAGATQTVSAKAHASEAPITAVTLETWRTWREKVDTSPMLLESSELLTTLQEHGLELSPEFQALCTRIDAADRLWTPSTSADDQSSYGGALESMILQCLIPLATGKGKTEAFFDALNGSEPVTEWVERAARLAGEVLS